MQDRRYQVFISSTFSDLENERRAAIEAIYEQHHIPIALERFPPTSETNVQVIRKAMESCQVYMLIVGHRYGSLLPDGSTSYMEYEYALALEHNLHILVFVLDDHLARERRKALDETNERDRKEKETFGRYQQFIARLQDHFLAYWTPQEFKYKVAIALGTLRDCQMPGFIREPADPTVLDTARNEFIVDIVSELKGFTKLYERCNQNTEVKRALTRFFVEVYMDTIIRSRVNLFFESGSTIAFLAKEMVPYLHGEVDTRDGIPNISITTNNVLAYLLLWLRARIPCSQFPWSPPFEATYGALYAGIAKLSDKHPDYRQTPLEPHARAEINELLSAHFAPRRDEKRITLLLGTSSGLQVQRPREIRFGKNVQDARRVELTSQIHDCLGPHVGSYHNKIFKRFMYATELPLVLFFDGRKLDCPVEAGKCHYILDSELPWNLFISKHPLAFCIGCPDSTEPGTITKSEAVRYFADHGFQILEENGTSGVGCFIARNAAFVEQFEKRCGPRSRSRGR